MGGQELVLGTQTLVFTAGGGGLTGGVLHFRDLGLQNSTLEISSTISASGYNGMVSGGYLRGNDKLLRMNYLPSAAIIRNNQQVVTSGSTVYPRGLIVGSIVDAGFETTGVAKFALLQAAADIDALEQVFIITQYTTDADVATAPTTTDTTTDTTADGTGETAATEETLLP